MRFGCHKVSASQLVQRTSAGSFGGELVHPVDRPAESLDVTGSNREFVGAREGLQLQAARAGLFGEFFCQGVILRCVKVKYIAGDVALNLIMAFFALDDF